MQRGRHVVLSSDGPNLHVYRPPVNRLAYEAFDGYYGRRSQMFDYQDYEWNSRFGRAGSVKVNIDNEIVDIEVDPVKGPRLGFAPRDYINPEEISSNGKLLFWKNLENMQKDAILIKVARQIVKLQNRRYTLEDERLPEKTEEEIAASQKRAQDRINELARRRAEEEAIALEKSKAMIVARCKKEQRRPHFHWQTITNDDVLANHMVKAKGLFYGIEFPWTEEMLEQWGPSWLTKAFHTAGTLDMDNRVTNIRIDKKNKITTGNNGGKFVFEAQYAKPTPGLHNKLFAKVPYPCDGATKSDRLSSSVNKQPNEFYELNTYRLLESTLPVRSPKFYFGDISNETSNWILITERIAFADPIRMNFGKPKPRNAALPPYVIEGPYDKCLDSNLRGSPKDYYLLLVRTGAMMAGRHKTGEMGRADLLSVHFEDGGSKTMSQWGVYPSGPSGMDARQFRTQLELAVSFISDTGKVCFPQYSDDAAFLDRFRDVMMTVNAYKGEIGFWKNYDNNYVALTHQNMNVDNAYFWRNSEGVLECGIFDWGGMGSLSVGHKLWWWLYCSDFGNLSKNLDEYIDAFIATYEESGGPHLDHNVLHTMIMLTALEQMLGLIAAVPQILKMCPKKEWPTVKNRYDKRISENIDGKSTLRLYLHVMNNIVRLIEEMDADKVMYKWVDEIYTVASVKKTHFMIHMVNDE